MRKIIEEFIILIVIGSLIWAAIALFIKLPEKPVLISYEKEIIFSEKYKDAILKLNGFSKIENTVIDSILSFTAEKLSSLVDSSQNKLNITLVESELVNAFALPAGNIIITSGLIEFCESTEELMAVLSHETGHIVKRHLITRLAKEIGMELLGSDNSFIITEIAKEIISTGYDRKQEEEADHFACELLEKAGIEPRILASFFRRLKNYEGQEFIENFEILYSHPDIEKRIRNILLFRGDNTYTHVEYFDIQELKDILKNNVLFEQK